MPSFQYPSGSLTTIGSIDFDPLIYNRIGAAKAYRRRVAFKRDAFVNTTALQDVSMQATGSTIVATNAPLGAAIEIVSSSADDTAAGTGARTVEIHYLDVNGVEQELNITLNGTTPVSLGTVCHYVNFTHVSSVGSNLIAAGTINIRNVATPTTIYSTVTVGNTDMTSLFTVPAGYYGILDGVEINVFHSTSGSNARVVLVSDGCDWDGRRYPGIFQAKFDHIYSAAAFESFAINTMVDSLSTIKLQATPSATAANLRVSGFYNVILIRIPVMGQ